ncbi:MAG TPA: hypothetical protein VFJ74_15460 [Gemmatimonadaceae bacterium]|nr:hypothetical protein [Gemmatimonadaceae bacterium]
MMPQIRLFVAAAVLLAGSAVEASAQFTAVVAPPPTRKEQAAVARSDSASRNVGARDSANATRLTDMKTWVDSATVALTGQSVTAPATPLDTAADAAHRPAPTPTAPVGATEPAMHDGARAPDTATPLPTLALLGTGALGAGLLLLRRRRA